jgi:GT2 family glycosyltransferase
MCLRGLYQTEYPDIEIIVADNGSVEPETAAAFVEARRSGVKVVDCAGPFNYSRINNQAARHATGEILLLLNNDIEIIEPAWLKEMVRYLLEPDIGAVGAKLLYPNHQVQHAGVVLGMGGVAGHMSVFASENAPGYAGALGIARDVSCVTGACMAIKKNVFDSLNGLNETDLKVAFNDVDFCIRLRESGYRIIFTPFAMLVHHESKSRGDDISGEKLLRFQREIKYMQNRWGDVLYHDPFYHPSLSLEGCNVDLAFPPRVTFPWRS